MAKLAKQAEVPLVKAYALVRVNGGWVMRTYLVPDDSLAEDTQVDTFGAAMGRITRELAREAR